MLEIVRERPWSVAHTVLDAEDGPPSDLSHLVSYKCQIRSKTATRNAKTNKFENTLLIDVSVAVLENVVTLSLTSTQTNSLSIQEAIIDLVGVDGDGNVEVLLEPEPVRITNRPSIP